MGESILGDRIIVDYLQGSDRPKLPRNSVFRLFRPCTIQIRTDQRADAQEVSMLSFLKKYDGVAAQNQRIINKDFPWLWAVSSFWSFSTVQVSISSRDRNDALEKLLMEPIGNRRLELWAHAENQRLKIFQVKQVEFRPGVPLMRSLLSLFPGGFEITGVVTIVYHNDRSVPLLNGKHVTKTVRVYRCRKDEDSFDLWLTTLMRKYDERVPF